MAHNLQPLITILEQILNPKQTHFFVTDNKPQLESLLQKAASLQKILENSSVPIKESLSLESRIRDAAHKAGDIIESNMLGQVLWWRRCMGLSFPFSTADVYLQQVMEEFDSITVQVVEILKGKTKKMPAAGSSTSAAAFLQADPPSSKNVAVVGFDKDLLQLKDRLTGYQSKLEIIPITGMGGIGKTTLARKLYEDPLIVSHFGVRAWTTISQDYNVREIFLGLLSRPNEKPSYELTQCTYLCA